MFIIYLPHRDDGTEPPITVLCQNYYDTYSRIYFADSLVNASATDSIVVVPNGNTSISSSVSKFPGGSSIYFDGTGDNIRIDPLNDLDPGIFEWTVEMYVYPTSNSGTRTLFVQRNSSFTNAPIWIRLSGLTLQASVRTSFTTSILNAGTLTLNAWNHIVVQRSAIRDALEIFLNGTLTGNTFLSNTLVLTTLSSDYWFIGGDNITNYFQGYIQGLLYTLGVAKYSGNFVPPEEQNNGSQCSLTTQEPPPEYVAYPGTITIAGSAQLSNVVTGGYVIPDSYSYLEIPTGNLANSWNFSCYYVPDGVETGYSTLFYTYPVSGAPAGVPDLSFTVYGSNYVPGPYSPKDRVKFQTIGSFSVSSTPDITLSTPLDQYSLNLFNISYTPNPNFWLGNAIPHANATVSISLNGNVIYTTNNFAPIGQINSTGYANGMVIYSYANCTSVMRIGRDDSSLSQTASYVTTRGIRGYVGPFNLT